MPRWSSGGAASHRSVPKSASARRRPEPLKPSRVPRRVLRQSTNGALFLTIVGTRSTTPQSSSSGRRATWRWHDFEFACPPVPCCWHRCWPSSCGPSSGVAGRLAHAQTAPRTPFCAGRQEATCRCCTMPNFGPEDHATPRRHAGVRSPLYTTGGLRFRSVPAVVKAKPEFWRQVEPLMTVLSGESGAIAKLSTKDLETIVSVALSGMSVETFRAETEQMA